MPATTISTQTTYPRSSTSQCGHTGSACLRALLSLPLFTVFVPASPRAALALFRIAPPSCPRYPVCRLPDMVTLDLSHNALDRIPDAMAEADSLLGGRGTQRRRSRPMSRALPACRLTSPLPFPPPLLVSARPELQPAAGHPLFSSGESDGHALPRLESQPPEGAAPAIPTVGGGSGAWAWAWAWAPAPPTQASAGSAPATLVTRLTPARFPQPGQPADPYPQQQSPAL